MQSHFPCELDVPTNNSSQSSSDNSPLINMNPAAFHSLYPLQVTHTENDSHSMVHFDSSPPVDSTALSDISLTISSGTPQGSAYSTHLQTNNKSNSSDRVSSSSHVLSHGLEINEQPSFDSSCHTGAIISTSSYYHLSYVSRLHCKSSFDSMNILRKTSALCDVILQVDSKRIPAHRVVLAASSPYFKAMFTGELNESKQLEVSLELSYVIIPF